MWITLRLNSEQVTDSKNASVSLHNSKMKSMEETNRGSRVEGE